VYQGKEWTLSKVPLFASAELVLKEENFRVDCFMGEDLGHFSLCLNFGTALRDKMSSEEWEKRLCHHYSNVCVHSLYMSQGTIYTFTSTQFIYMCFTATLKITLTAR
jgi:hypothetical protein